MTAGGPHGITVNTVLRVGFPRKGIGMTSVIKDEYLSTIPDGRWGTPEGVGNAVAYFASDGHPSSTGNFV